MIRASTRMLAAVQLSMDLPEFAGIMIGVFLAGIAVGWLIRR